MPNPASDTNSRPSCPRPGGKPQPRNLSEFISRLVAGEETAWREMWTRYAGASLGAIRRLIAARNWFALRGWEEDVLVDSFVRLLRGVERFRGTSWQELDRFVRANLVFTCLQKLRELARWPQGPALEEASNPVPAAEEDHLAVLECEQILRDAIAALPPDLAEIIHLNLAGHCSLEVAQWLRVSRQTVFDRKHRALCLLRDHLRRQHFWEQCAPYLSQLRLARHEEPGS